MIEKTILDRVPNYPGRVILSPVAGMTNTFDMKRADDPVVEGTPLDKATLDSIIKSRLTGRYYVPEVTRAVQGGRIGVTTNPIPVSGWVFASAQNKSTAGSFTLAVSSVLSYDYPPHNATDGNMATAWNSASATDHIFAINISAPIVVKKIKYALLTSTTYGLTTYFEGTSDGENWAQLFSTTEKPVALTEYSLTSTGEYTQYRLRFVCEGAMRVELREFAISSYDFYTYSNAFVIGDEFPSVWTEGQRAMIQTPADLSTFGVINNTVNGVPCNMILQPNKRYELRYNGSAFDAKEV